MKFSKDEVKDLVDAYVAVKSEDYDVRTGVVKNLAELKDVTVPVVRGVLVAAGVYVAKEVSAKAGVSGKKKDDVLAAIDAFMGLKLPSFKNASAKDLNVFWERLVEMSERANLNE